MIGAHLFEGLSPWQCALYALVIYAAVMSVIFIVFKFSFGLWWKMYNYIASMDTRKTSPGLHDDVGPWLSVLPLILFFIVWSVWCGILYVVKIIAYVLCMYVIASSLRDWWHKSGHYRKTKVL